MPAPQRRGRQKRSKRARGSRRGAAASCDRSSSYFFWGSICPLTRDLSLTVLLLLSYSIPVALIIPRGSALVTGFAGATLSSFGITSRYSLVTVVGPSFAVSDEASRTPLTCPVKATWSR